MEIRPTPISNYGAAKEGLARETTRAQCNIMIYLQNNVYLFIYLFTEFVYLQKQMIHQPSTQSGLFARLPSPIYLARREDIPERS